MVCCCSNPVCEKYGCQSWANIVCPTKVTAEYIQPVLLPDKKPYKCPVCEGKGTYLGIDAIPIQNCNACEGKGIVWG